MDQQQLKISKQRAMLIATDSNFNLKPVWVGSTILDRAAAPLVWLD